MPRKPATRPRDAAASTRGLIVRRHGATGRSYRFDGVKFVSVSGVNGILFKYLADWAARLERAHVARVSFAELERVKRDAVDLLAMGRDPIGAFPIEELWTTRINAAAGDFAHKGALAEAANIGTLVHHAIERWLMEKLAANGDGPPPEGAPIELDGAAGRSFNRWLDWAEATNLDPICAERSVCSVEDRYAGTFDWLALVEGVPAILDWKTGANVYLEHYLQVSAYRRAYNAFPDGQVRGVSRVDAAYIVHLPKTEDQEVEATAIPVDRDELDHHGATFVSLVPAAYRIAEWKAARKAS